MTRLVLVADDTLSIHDAVQEALSGLDVELEMVFDGEEAAAALEARLPDLLLADVHMPGKNGYELSALAKQHRAELPVVLLCGTFERFDGRAFEKCGAEACLRKPFVEDDVLEQVSELLGPLERSAAEPGVPEVVDTSHTGEAAVVASGDETGGPVTEAGEEERPLPDSQEEEAAASEEPAAASRLVVEGLEELGAESEESEEVRAGSGSGPLSDEDVERIARRVVELAGDGVLREIAWEVVPDLAEVVIRERLAKLEAELEAES